MSLPETSELGSVRPQAKKKLMSVYINRDLVDRLESIAKEDHRTKSGQVELILSEYLATR